MADENIPAPAGEPVQTPASTPAPAPAPTEPVNQAPAPAPEGELVTPPEPTTSVLDNAVVADDGTVEYEPTGDAALDVALSFIGNLGIAGNDPAMQAAAVGNFALLEAKLATLGDKAQGWQQMIALAKQAQAASAAKVAEQVAQTDKAILSVVQSADNWKAITTWAAKTATPEEKAEINRMIDGGPVQARAAATLLLEAYRKATGTAINPPNPARSASPAADTSGGPLSPREYATAVAALHRKLGTRMESSQEYRALQARLAR